MYKNRKEELEYKKNYRETHKDEIRQYYLDNKDKILKSQKRRKMLNPWVSHLENMSQRCNNPNCPDYKWYGGRGIRCLLKLKDVHYLWFRDKAYLMKNPSVDRIDNNKNYSLTNCKFIEILQNIKKGNKEEKK